MNKKVTIGVVVLVIIVAVVGIVLATHKNKNSTTSTTTSSMGNMDMSGTGSSSSSSSSSATATATNSVAIQNFAFSPASITVKKGTAVTWTNKDSAAHTVTETDDQNGPKSSDLAQGKTYSFTYNTAGTFKYDCSIHPYMTATVTVTN